MKTLKISSFIILTVLLNCTVEDIGKTFETVVVNPQQGNGLYFTPPEWIKGVWHHNDNNKVQFTAKDVIFSAYDSYSWTSISMNGQLNMIRFGDYQKKLTEEISTDSSYLFTIGDRYGNNLTNYLFQKTSLDSILYTQSGLNNIWTRKYGRRD